MLRLLIVEAVTLAVVYRIARIRGWASTVFRFQVTWRWTGGGLLLWVGTLFATHLLYSLARANGYHPVMLLRVAQGDVTLPFILAVSLINPVFEEFLGSGYVITMLSQFGMWPAVLSSALLRACLHLYQGDFQAVVIFALGVIFGLTYSHWRRLWPLIVAHALMDFLGLLHGNAVHPVQVIN